MQLVKEMIIKLVVYQIIIISKKNQQAFDADPKTIQQINFAGNLDRAEGETIFSIIEEAEKTFLDFSQETVRVLLIYFALM